MRYLPVKPIAVALCAAAPVQADEITLLSDSDFGWERTAEGVAFAPLHGDRFAGAYQALVELPAGTVSPPHVKTANMYGVMIKGEMIHYPAGEAADGAKRVGPGSYYLIPGGLAHISACVSDSVCVTYLYQDGAFDFVPVEP